MVCARPNAEGGEAAGGSSGGAHFCAMKLGIRRVPGRPISHEAMKSPGHTKGASQLSTLAAVRGFPCLFDEFQEQGCLSRAGRKCSLHVGFVEVRVDERLDVEGLPPAVEDSAARQPGRRRSAIRKRNQMPEDRTMPVAVVVGCDRLAHVGYLTNRTTRFRRAYPELSVMICHADRPIAASPLARLAGRRLRQIGD